MTKTSLCLVIGQIPQSARVGENLREIRRAIEEAAAMRGDLLALPECALTGYGPAFYTSAAQFDAAEVKDGVECVRAAARAARTAVALGTHLPRGGGWTNSSLLIDAQGCVRARYDKAHLYGRDPEFYAPGRRRPVVTTLARRAVRVGMQICFDVRFPEPFRWLAERGADVMLVPSYIHGRKDMWKRPVIAGHAASRAAENGRYVAFVNAAGRAQNAPSCVADPRGVMIAVAPRGARRLLRVVLDAARVSDAFLQCRRTDLYPAARRGAAAGRTDHG